jgi:hypothetical protein
MARIIIDNRFRRVTRELEQEIDRAVEIAARAGAAAARGAETDYHIREDVLSKINSTPARRSRRGISALIVAPDYRSWWFERGTHAKQGRRRSTRGRASTVEGSRGVKPQKFMRKATRTAKALLQSELHRRIGR